MASPAIAATKIILDEQFFAQAARELSRRDSDLAAVIKNYGLPPLWTREPGFRTLIYIILEQQVSLASARALYQRLQDAVRPFTPGRFLMLAETEMRQLGFSRQKLITLAYLQKLFTESNSLCTGSMN